MKQIDRVKKNSFFALLTQFIRLFANFFVFIGIARLYGPKEFGQFTAAHTLSTVCLLFADYGFDTLLVTEIASCKEKAHNIIQTFFSMKVLFSVFATIIMVIIAGIQPLSGTTRSLMYLFSLYVLLSALINFFLFLFRSYEEFHLETKISFVMNSFLLVTVIFMGLMQVSLFVIASIFIGSRLICVVMAVYESRSKINWKEFHFTFANKQEFGKINIYGLQMLFGNLFFTIDTILLSFLSDEQQVGLYQSVFKIVLLSLLGSDILVYSVLPILSRYFQDDYDAWLKLSMFLQKVFMYGGMFISFFMIVYPTQIITLVYGQQAYYASIPLMRIFGFVIFVRYCSETSALLLTSSHHQSKRLFVVVIATIFNIVANILIIPRFGIMGVASISLITNILIGIGYLLCAQNLRFVWPGKKTQYLPIIISAICAFIFWDGRLLNLWISIPLASAIIISAIYFWGFDSYEREKIFSLNDIKRIAT